MLAFLLSKPDNWRTNVSHLRTQGPAGRDKVQKILRELETAGYVRRAVNRNEDGTFENITDIFDDPQPLTEKPDAGSAGRRSTRSPEPAVAGISGHIVNTQRVNTEPVNTKKVNTEKKELGTTDLPLIRHASYTTPTASPLFSSSAGKISNSAGQVQLGARDIDAEIARARNSVYVDPDWQEGDDELDF